jgi:hypothetical protein
LRKSENVESKSFRLDNNRGVPDDVDVVPKPPNNSPHNVHNNIKNPIKEIERGTCASHGEKTLFNFT